MSRRFHITRKTLQSQPVNSKAKPVNKSCAPHHSFVPCHPWTKPFFGDVLFAATRKSLSEQTSQIIQIYLDRFNDFDFLLRYLQLYKARKKISIQEIGDTNQVPKFFFHHLPTQMSWSFLESASLTKSHGNRKMEDFDSSGCWTKNRGKTPQNGWWK